MPNNIRQFLRWGSGAFRRKWTAIFALMSALINIGYNFNIQALQWTRVIPMESFPQLTLGLIVSIGAILGAWWAWKMEY